jgi:uncharacterized protein (DUF2141 family)
MLRLCPWSAFALYQICCLLIVLFLVSWSGDPESDASAFTVQVEGIRGQDGRLLVLVFETENGFPSDSSTASALLEYPLSESSSMDGTLSLQVPIEKAGRYAVSVLHDENGNGVMDTNLFGIPQEGYGISNNARRAMAPPRFEEALVDWSPQHAVTVAIGY